MKRIIHFLLLLLFAFLSACTSNSVDPEESSVIISFEHINNNTLLVLNQPIYTNAVGQQYSIKTVKYFISRVTFHNSNGTDYMSPDIHYVDIKDTGTLSLTLTNKIPYGNYSGISFVYGLAPEDNSTGSLGIDLDRLMEWPEMMGGGYHYMKLEGDYIGTNGAVFFNFHTGSLNKEDYSIQVNLPKSDIIIEEKTLQVNLIMNIENWFQNPTNWDFEYWGSGIMGNLAAQATVQENSKDIFSVEFLGDNN